ncbi:MAG: calcium-binding protein [Phenylobacterium sp.]
MAIVIAGNTGIDMNNPAIGALADGVQVAATLTYGALQTGLWLDEFYGDFQYDLFGDLAGGTLTGWKESYNGQLVFQITGANVPVSTFLNWVATDANITAVTTILAGSDTVTGSGFSDRLYGYAGDDSIAAGGGEDTIQSGAGADTVSGGLGNDQISDSGGSNFLRGNEGNDVLTGGTGFDDVHGNMGNDTVSGGGGDDWVVGGQDNDLQYGGDGHDVVYGNLGSDSVNGDAGNDWVRGGQQNDVLDGGAGDDWMSGDRHNDTLTGGSGADLFNLFTGSGEDRILDFNALAGDRIRWEGGLPTYTISQVGLDAVISYGGGDQVTLVGVSASSLSGTGWFVLA